MMILGPIDLGPKIDTGERINRQKSRIDSVLQDLFGTFDKLFCMGGCVLGLHTQCKVLRVGNGDLTDQTIAEVVQGMFSSRFEALQ